MRGRRERLYPPLARIANRGPPASANPPSPRTSPGWWTSARPPGSNSTPLLLRYGAGGYNCLHQDVYGDVTFPLQVAIMLNTPGEDFTGGESVFVEQRPRQQSRPVVARPGLGEGLVFPVRHRPVPGARGFRRVALRHGVSEVRSGDRHVLGIIFHNAR